MSVWQGSRLSHSCHTLCIIQLYQLKKEIDGAEESGCNGGMGFMGQKKNVIVH